MTSPLPSLRTFLALALMTVWPIETWPSPPITTLPPLRTVKMVVPCQTGGSFGDACMKCPRVRPDLGVGGQGYNPKRFERSGSRFAEKTRQNQKHADSVTIGRTSAS